MGDCLRSGLWQSCGPAVDGVGVLGQTFQQVTVVTEQGGRHKHRASIPDTNHYAFKRLHKLLLVGSHPSLYPVESWLLLL